MRPSAPEHLAASWLQMQPELSGRICKCSQVLLHLQMRPSAPEHTPAWGGPSWIIAERNGPWECPYTGELPPAIRFWTTGHYEGQFWKSSVLFKFFKCERWPLCLFVLSMEKHSRIKILRRVGRRSQTMWTLLLLVSYTFSRRKHNSKDARFKHSFAIICHVREGSVYKFLKIEHKIENLHHIFNKIETNFLSVKNRAYRYFLMIREYENMVKTDQSLFEQISRNIWNVYPVFITQFYIILNFNFFT